MIFTDTIKDVIMNPPVRSVRKQGSFYPSSASCVVLDPKLNTRVVVGACLRKQYYQIKGVVPTDTGSPENALKREMGGHIQAIIEEKLKQAGLWMASETSVYIDRHKVSGRIDTWAWDPASVGGKGPKIPVMLEFKSLGRFREKGIISGGKDATLLPEEGDILQVMPYLDYYSQFPEYFHGEPARCVIFTIGRDSLNWVEHVVTLGGKGQYGMALKDDERHAIVQNKTGIFQMKFLSLRGLYNRWLQLSDHLRKKEIPDRDYELQYSNETLSLMAAAGMLTKTDATALERAQRKDPDGNQSWLKKGDWRCGWCDFQTHCYSGIKHEAAPLIAQDAPTTGRSAPIPITDPVGEF